MLEKPLDFLPLLSSQNRPKIFNFQTGKFCFKPRQYDGPFYTTYSRGVLLPKEGLLLLGFIKNCLHFSAGLPIFTMDAMTLFLDFLITNSQFSIFGSGALVYPNNTTIFSPPDTPSVHKSHGTKCRGMGGLKTLHFRIFIRAIYFMTLHTLISQTDLSSPHLQVLKM